MRVHIGTVFSLPKVTRTSYLANITLVKSCPVDYLITIQWCWSLPSPVACSISQILLHAASFSCQY